MQEHTPQRQQPRVTRRLPLLVTVLIVTIMISGPIPIPPGVGTGDFRAYWSASYLLAESEDFTNPDLLLALEREQTGWQPDWPMITWNPPWLLSILIPYTFFSFERAAWLWLLTNIALVFGGAVLVWQASGIAARTAQRAWVAPLIAFLFVPTLTALMMGQVNSLVFFGLAAFLHFDRKDSPVAAGACLALTLVKPHLVYATLPLILLNSVRKGQWRLLVGLGAPLVGLTVIVFFLRPTFMGDYGRAVVGGDLLRWETPTIGGILETTIGWQWTKLMGLAVLPLATAIWWLARDRVQTVTLVGIATPIALATAPFGWSYDAIILLVPVLQIAAWVSDDQFGRLGTVGLLLPLIVANGVVLCLRVVTISEVWYFWLPLVVAASHAGAVILRWRNARHDLANPNKR